MRLLVPKLGTGTRVSQKNHAAVGAARWPDLGPLRVQQRMDDKLRPPSWKRATEADDWIAVSVLMFAIFCMALEAFAR